MQVKYHLAISAIIGSIIYAITSSFLNGLISFLAGVLIDIDHLIDYYLNYGLSFKFKAIYEAIKKTALPKLYLFLHSYELLLIFWILIFFIPLRALYLCIAIGLTQHIFLDQIFNPVTARGYLLSYRINRGFKKEYIVSDPKSLPQ
ncbi:MAG: hypothetical protein PHO42_01425 [Candidatus Omnitrophica bacterium]|nr:hypothetical protein [Candidatus Omnitrophota bacterium]